MRTGSWPGALAGEAPVLGAAAGTGAGTWAALAIAAAVALTLLAGFFVSAEVAVTRATSIGAAPVGGGAPAPAAGGRCWAGVMADPARHLNLVLLLRVCCEVLAVLSMAVGFTALLGVGWPALVAAAAVMVVIEFVFIGVTPRILGRQFAGPLARASAAAIYPVQLVLWPLAQGLVRAGLALTPRGKGEREGPFSSETELRRLVDLAERGRVIDAEERQMIHSVFKLDDTAVREVMVPRTEIVFTSRADDADEVLTLALRSGFSRIPVTGQDEDDVVGIVYLKDLVARLHERWTAAAARGGEHPDGPLTAGDVMRPAAYVPDSKPIDEVLREMQQSRHHVAVVIDEYGGTAGLITLEDIVEEIVGEITDEYDNEVPPVQRLGEDRARVMARLPLGDLAELFGVCLEEPDVETVGGLMAYVLGRVPISGSQAVYAGLRLTAEEGGGRRNRTSTVLVERLPAQGRDGVDPVESEAEGGRGSGDGPALRPRT